MVTLGVDFASQSNRTATRLVGWDQASGHAVSLSAGATDFDLHELFRRAEQIGIDARFGWPRGYARAVSDHAADTVRPSVAVPCLRFWRTDEFERERIGRWPPSVSSDSIAVPAMRAARLLAKRAAAGEAFDRSGSIGRIVKTCAPAALSLWG